MGEPRNRGRFSLLGFALAGICVGGVAPDQGRLAEPNGPEVEAAAQGKLPQRTALLLNLDVSYCLVDWRVLARPEADGR
jgi:hypothetical protein